MTAGDGIPQGSDPPGSAVPGGARRERRGLGELLRGEATRHEPDRDRILAAIREGQLLAPADDVTPPAGTSSRGRAGPARRRRLAWPVAAASVTVLALATVAGARMLAPEAPPPTARSTPAGTSSLGPAVTIDETPTPSSERPTASVGRPISTDRPAATPRTRRAGAGQPAGSLADAVSIRVSPTSSGTQLSLPRPGDRDWIVVGGRDDGVLVRAKSPSRPLGSVTVSGYGPAVVNGPYRVSWQGGMPEQDHSQAPTWQSITAVDGRIRITVPLRGDRFGVDLFAGTVRVTGQVAVRLAGSSSAPVQALLQPCRTDVCADVVSVAVDASKLPAAARSGQLLIDLGPAHPGDPFGLGLAAVALR